MSNITIKQIAAEAGVSIGTVDRVLHDRGRVSAQSKARVLDICRKYNYAQNIVGKAMAMQRRRRTIAVVIRAADRNRFSAQVYAGVQAMEAEVRDYNIAFVYHDLRQDTAEEQVQILTRLEREDLDGLIIKPIDSPLVRMHLDQLIGKKVPVVLCTSDMDLPGKLCFVGQDHYRDGRLMANMLSKLCRGPLHILMLAAPLQTRARRARIDGFLSYLRAYRQDFHICGMREVASDARQAREEVLAALRAHPEAQALYINLEDMGPCMEGLDAYGRFQGLRFCFGHQQGVWPYLRQGKLDFAIGEVPFRHGCRAGEVLFKYLLSGETPQSDSCIFRGTILLEENGATE